jgi:aryl-alcohol dehydrogenase-like predicted oxidoreductase
VSVVGLGCNNFGWQIGVEESRAVVHKALDLGITLLDTADIYGNRGGSEEALGQILGDRRKDIVLASKFAGPMDDAGRLKGASRRYIMQAVEASLKRLRTDWIDLYQLHFPDPLTPLEETLRALDDLVRQGKVRYIGCSNLPGWQVVETQWVSRTEGIASFVSCQDEYSLLARGIERDLLPPMQAYGLGLLPYFPLAAGLLTGKYRQRSDFPADTRFAKVGRLADKYVNDANWTIVEALTGFCDARGRKLLELAFSWLAARPTVASVIAGATRPEQVEQNVAAAGWTLSPDELGEVDKLTAKG